MKPSILPRLLLIVVALAAFGLAGSARAQLAIQPPPNLESVDLPAVNAWTVVVGTVADFDAADRSQDFRDRRAPEATLIVAETLKGPRGPRIKARLPFPVDILAGWKRTSARLLVSIPWDPDAPSTVVDLSAPNLAVLTADLRLLRQPQEAIREVKARLRQTEGIRKAERFPVPIPAERIAGTTLVKPEWRGIPEVLVDVPVDERLERRAQRDATSLDGALRSRAARALGNFRSERNIGLLKTLLGDEEWGEWSYYYGNLLARARTNPVRQAASNSLQVLGIPGVEPFNLDPPDLNAQIVAAELDGEMGKTVNLEALAPYPPYRNLEDLYLAGAMLAPGDFAAIGRLKSLKSLFLEGSNTRDADLAALAELPNLAYLALGNTPVTDAGLLTLAKFTALKRVDLGGDVTEAGIAALRRLRPDLLLRLDEFAFLSPFVTRRVEQPYARLRESTMPTGQYGTPGRGFEGLRGYFLVFPAENAARVASLLRRELPRRGWKEEIAPDGVIRYLRASTAFATRTGKWAGDTVVFNPNVTERRPVHGEPPLASGELSIRIQRNANPRPTAPKTPPR